MIIFMKAKFDVGEDRKRFIMLKFNKTWKTFKYKLTAYVKEHIDEPELLRHPPTGQEWGSIPQEDWNQFVESRKSVEFKVMKYYYVSYFHITTLLYHNFCS